MNAQTVRVILVVTLNLAVLRSNFIKFVFHFFSKLTLLNQILLIQYIIILKVLYLYPKFDANCVGHRVQARGMFHTSRASRIIHD